MTQYGDVTITTQGDLLQGASGGDSERLAVGTVNQVLKTDGTSASWTSAVATSVLAGATHTSNAVALIPKLLRARFTYSDQPGAGAKAIFASTDIPDNAIITGGFVDVITTFAGTGDDANTIAIHVEGANDIVTATAISAATDWDAGLHDIIPDATGSTAVKTTAARDITVTVVDGAGVLSAGVMDIYLYYVQGS